MAETSIEWTQHRWNPIVGCTVVSPGCTNCYAMAIAERFKDVYRGRPFVGTPAGAMTRKVNGKPVWTGQLTLAPERTLTEPLRRRKPTTWFVNSMGDPFHEAVPDEWIDRIFAVMALTPHHTYQVLTKRSARMRAYCTRPGVYRRIGALICDMAIDLRMDVVLIAPGTDEGQAPPGPRVHLDRWPLPNVWLGVSAEDQRRADERIPDLLSTPAAIRFVSAEPLLGPIDFTEIMHAPGHALHALWGLKAHTDGTASYGDKLDWIIVGGESGREARPMHPDWARQIRDQCAAAGTAFFFKQWGEFAPLASFTDPAATHEGLPEQDRAAVYRLGKKAAGRLLDGVQHDAMPEVRR